MRKITLENGKKISYIESTIKQGKIKQKFTKHLLDAI